MKFKTKEDLIGPEMSYPDEQEIGIEIGREQGVEVAFDSFKERVEFYEKYSKAGGSFKKEYPEEYKKFDVILNEKNITNQIAQNSFWLHWLFSYCFGDIKNGKS